MARNVYYPDDFEAHKNLSHKQFSLFVYYFMDVVVVYYCPISCCNNWKDNRRYIWDANQTERNIYGQINNPLMNMFNTAVLLLPDIPMFEGCRKAALDRAVTVSLYG